MQDANLLLENSHDNKFHSQYYCTLQFAIFFIEFIELVFRCRNPIWKLHISNSTSSSAHRSRFVLKTNVCLNLFKNFFATELECVTFVRRTRLSCLSRENYVVIEMSSMNSTGRRMRVSFVIISTKQWWC